MSATKTKNRKKPANRKRSTRSKPVKKPAIDMFIPTSIRKDGKRVKTLVTRYSCGGVDDALENKSNIRIIKKGKKVAVGPRRVHRTDLFAPFGETHEQAGQGKYVDLDCVSEDMRTVNGADHVIPYLASDGSYAAIIKAFFKKIGKKVLEGLTAKVATNRVDGQHLQWQGKRNADDCVAASPWMTADELWDLALSMNPKLRQLLSKVKSQREDVSEHLTSHEQIRLIFRRYRNIIRALNRKFSAGLFPSCSYSDYITSGDKL